MAITSLSGASAGMQYPYEYIKVGSTQTAGKPYVHFYAAGFPAAATAPSPGMSGAALTTYTGQIPFVNPASGHTRLGRFSCASGQAGILMLCDRLWHNSGIDVTNTGAQTINSVAWPARDTNGSTNGAEVFVGLEVSTVCGAATPTITASYTNSAGTAGRTSTTLVATTSSAPVGSFFPLGLQAGDVGVRSVQTITLSASWLSGVVHLVAFRILAVLELAPASWQRRTTIDYVTSGAVRLYDNSVPFTMLIPFGSASTTLTGGIQYTQG